jgi:hypothetical protein
MKVSNSRNDHPPLKYDSGSFRDRNGRIFYSGNSVYRALSAEALQDWNLLSSTKFFADLSKEGRIIQTEQLPPDSTDVAVPDNNWAVVLKHARIPFISYPYEWCFGMLKDAALLHTRLLTSAIREDLILKDSSAFNVQWHGVSPVFIDILSFTKLLKGAPWEGYRQFCQMFLYPLFLQAYKDVPFHSWLRGSVDGIPVEYFSRMLSLRDLIRKGVFTHAYLQSKFQASYSNTNRNIRTELRTIGFSKELIKRNIEGLERIVKKVHWKLDRSEWSNYAGDNSYTTEDQQRKIDFVRDAVHTKNRKLVWDLGCNTGVFSRIASENADYVVSMDADHLSVERFYLELKREGDKKILPLVMNLTDSSPGLGWRGQERKTLQERGSPDLILALALIHHIVIGSNIPVPEVIDWLANLQSDVIIEFPTKEDPMVKKLLLNKRDLYTDYELPFFEAELSRTFQIVKREVLCSGTRVIYFARRKN